MIFGQPRSGLRVATELLVGDRDRLNKHAAKVRSLLASSDPVATADYWVAERVFPRAHANAIGIGIDRADWTERRAAMDADAASAAAFQELAAIQLTRALASEGVIAMVLKGAPTALRLYTTLTLRQTSVDLDLLVASRYLDRASGLVERLGWEPSHEPLFSNGLPDYHHTHLSQGLAPTVEVHWRVQWYDERSHTESLLANAVTIDGLKVPAALDILGIALLGYARDGFHRLRIAADIAAWWETFGQLHGRDVEAMLSSGPLARPLTIAAQAAAHVVGTPQPQLRAVDRLAKLAEGVALADEPCSARVFHAQRALIDVAVCPAHLRGARFKSMWFRHPAILRSHHPQFPEAGIPVLRGVSAARTLGLAAPLAVRGVRSRHRSLA